MKTSDQFYVVLITKFARNRRLALKFRNGRANGNRHFDD